MQKMMGFLILQLCVISVVSVYASQSVALATTKASKKAVTAELLEAVKKKKQRLTISLLSLIRAQTSTLGISMALPPSTKQHYLVLRR